MEFEMFIINHYSHQSKIMIGILTIHNKVMFKVSRIPAHLIWVLTNDLLMTPTQEKLRAVEYCSS